MKKDVQIVNQKIQNLDKSKLHFVETDRWDNPEEYQDNVKYEIQNLKRTNNLIDRVAKIVELTEAYATFDTNNRFQCRDGANRSTVDIWRIYNNYFRPVSIFSIMRALYKLVVEDDIETLFCHDIKKQVFFPGSDSDLDSVFVVNELGVRFAEWRTIGL